MFRLRCVLCGSWRVLTVAMIGALAAPVAIGQSTPSRVQFLVMGMSTPAQKAAQAPTPVVTAINPSSVPPGWEGQVEFKGSNFSKNMKLRLDCSDQTLKPRNFTVESAERAVFQLKVPPEIEESKCVIVLEVPPSPVAETGPTPQGSSQIVQVTGPSLSISESSGLAKSLKACFLMEGDVPPMQVMTAMAQAMQTGDGQDECKLMVATDSIKYAVKGKVILDAPASAVKEAELILIFGQQSGTFRIVLASGKVYNFFEPGNRDEENPITDQIKKKLKK